MVLFLHIFGIHKYSFHLRTVASSYSRVPLGPIDIEGHLVLCGRGGRGLSVHCGMFYGNPTLYPLYVHRILQPS